ncbi:Elongation of fatty acids protein 2 [Actinomortierella ambigua]|nr:Elongation of fatty acids protein 2 [Actinomortierella ambigua]
MGVKGFTNLLREFAPDAIKPRAIGHYRGKTLAIDVSCFLNRFIYGPDPHPARVQQGLYRLAIRLEQYNIRPVFVFDGKDRIAEKKRENDRRDLARLKVRRSLQFERLRKSRLSEIKGSARLLRHYSPEQVSTILESIRLDDDSASDDVVTATTDAAADATPDAATAMQSRTKAKGQRSSGRRDHDAESLAVTESVAALLSRQPKVQVEGVAKDDFEAVSKNDFEAVSKKTLAEEAELDREQELLQVLHETLLQEAGPDYTYDPDSGADDTLETEGGDLLPRAEALIEQEEEAAAVRDAVVVAKVQTALNNFVRTIDDSSQMHLEEMEMLTSKKQKELHQLELDLAHQIKTLSSSGGSSSSGSSSSQAERQHVETQELELAPQPMEAPSHAKDLILPSAPSKDDFAELPSGTQLPHVPDKDDTAVEFSLQEDPTIPSSDNEGITELSWEESAPDLQVQDEDILKDLASDDDDNDDDHLSPESESVVHVSSHLDVVPTAELHTKVEDALGSAPMLDASERPIRGAEVGQTIRQVLSTHETVFWNLERRSIRITWNLVVSCRKLMDAMGQVWVSADDAEAEAVCARLTDRGLADGTVSEDSDTAVFGDGVWIRHFGSKVKGIVEVNPVVAREQLGITREAFRDLCILCGTDFSDTIEGIGPKRAVRLIKRYGSIESIMANTGYKPREFFLYDHARRVFCRTPTIPEDMAVYQRRPPNEDKLRPLLLKYDIRPDEVLKDVLDEIKAEETMVHLAGNNKTTDTDKNKDPNVFPSQPYDFKRTLGLKAWPHHPHSTGTPSP